MRKHDARTLDHATLEALRERAVQRKAQQSLSLWHRKHTARGSISRKRTIGTRRVRSVQHFSWARVSNNMSKRERACPEKHNTS